MKIIAKIYICRIHFKYRIRSKIKFSVSQISIIKITLQGLKITTINISNTFSRQTQHIFHQWPDPKIRNLISNTSRLTTNTKWTHFTGNLILNPSKTKLPTDKNFITLNGIKRCIDRVQSIPRNQLQWFVKMHSMIRRKLMTSLKPKYGRYNKDLFSLYKFLRKIPSNSTKSQLTKERPLKNVSPRKDIA